MISIVLTITVLINTADDLNPAALQDFVQQGLEYAYIDDYDSALVFFQMVQEQYPDNPAGYFFTAALYQLRMMDGCHYDHEELYMSLIQQAINKADSILQLREDLWARYYLGSSYTYRAVYEGLKDNLYGTFTYGVKGGKILQEIIKIDSTFYDAYLGAGVYEYFWARAARYLPVLKIGGGSIQGALEKLHTAAEHSLYSGPTALNSLVFIYREEKEYSKANAMIDELLTRYPGGRTFLWTKAELEFKQGHYRSAIDLYRSLHDMYLAFSPPNYSNCAQCKLLEGKCFIELREVEAARDALKMVITYDQHSERYPAIKEFSREAYGLLVRMY